MKKNNIEFIEVSEGRLTNFRNALHKEMFIQTRKKDTYILVDNGNAAVEKLYILVDTERTGFVLNDVAVTYSECLLLIEHYL